MWMKKEKNCNRTSQRLEQEYEAPITRSSLYTISLFLKISRASFSPRLLLEEGMRTIFSKQHVVRFVYLSGL